MRRPDKMRKRKKASALLLGSYLAIILAPTVAIIIVYMMMQRALLDIQKEKTQNLTNEAAITFNQEVEQLISITQYITYGEELKRYMEAREAWDPSQDYYQAYKLAESYPDYALINRFAVLFFTSGTITGAIDPASNNELYRHYECMAPIAGPDGTRIAWTNPNQALIPGAACITDKCENVEAALRWIDYIYSETGDLRLEFGPDEGVDWVLNPEGKVGINGEPALYEILNTYSPEAQNHDWQDFSLRSATASSRLGQAMDINVDPYSPEGLEKLLYDTSAELYEPYADNTPLKNLPPLKVSSEESSDISTSAVEIEKVIAENSIAFITGAKDIDTEWDNYLTALDSVGLPAYLDLYQLAYDRSQGK